MATVPPRRRLGALLDAFTARDGVVAALALFLVLYYAGTRGIYQGKASGDGFFGFMYLPAAVFHHSLDIGPTVPQWVPYLGREKTGHVPNACPIGPAVFWVPTYLLALAVEKIEAIRFHLRPPALPGQSVFDFWMAGLGSLVAGLLGIATLFRLLRRKLGTGPARAGVVVAVLATPITWYLVTQPLYQHACAFFAVTLFVERWDAWRTVGGLSPRRMAMLGALGGLAMLMRLQEAIWLLLPGLDVLLAIARELSGNGAKTSRGTTWVAVGKHVWGGVLLAVFALVVFSPQLFLWHWLFGYMRPPQPPGHMRWLDPALVATLFSMRGGLLPWAPVLYLMVPGLILGRRPLGGLAGRLGFLFAVELWVNAAAWDHWGSWTFGPRRFTDATVTFAAAFGGLWWWASTQSPRRAVRAVVATLLALAVLGNGLYMELVRQQKIKSSGAGAFPFSTWVTWAKGPAWLASAADRIGYPFVQPAGWIYGLVYHVPPRTFEGVVGSYFLERDSRIHAVVQTPTLTFKEPGAYVPDGLTGPADKSGLVPAARRVRILVPLFAREPIRMRLGGSFGKNESAVGATWNGTPLTVKVVARDLVSFEVPAALVHTRAFTNELNLDLPDGSRLGRLDFESLGDWW